MSKMLQTKKRILLALSERNKTMSELSSELGLANSTVSKHLKELQAIGAISKVESGRKWKYYRKNTGFNFPESISHRGYISKSVIAASAISAAIIIIIAAAIYINTGSVQIQNLQLAPGSIAPNGVTVMEVSDSPQYYNISAVNITLSSALLHSSTGKNYIVKINKTVDLVKLRNISEILGAAKLAYGNYTYIALFIKNASATVSGKTVSVFIPSSKILIPERFNITPNVTNWISLDFNLERSLHFTGNGKIIMLPVIYYSNGFNASIQVSSNYTPIFIKKGRIQWNNSAFGMESNGAISRNFSIPLNQSMVIKGHRIVVGPVSGFSIFILKRGYIGALIYNSSVPQPYNLPFNISNFRCYRNGFVGALICVHNHNYNESYAIKAVNISTLYTRMSLQIIAQGIGSYNLSASLMQQNGSSYSTGPIYFTIPPVAASAILGRMHIVEFNGVAVNKSYELKINYTYAPFCGKLSISSSCIANAKSVEHYYSLNLSVLSNQSSIRVALPGRLLSYNGILVTNMSLNNSQSNITIPLRKILINSTVEASEASYSSIKLPLEAYNCTQGKDCIVVPITKCQNGLPTQRICIASSYYQEYASEYSNTSKSAYGAICPDFVIESNYSCGCTGGSCGLIYTSR
ncbi:MAG: DUF4382 domain-containing protein [Candidatus Micrarchaeaceae archaeon]